jgi:hypothetical protein
VKDGYRDGGQHHRNHQQDGSSGIRAPLHVRLSEGIDPKPTNRDGEPEEENTKNAQELHQQRLYDGPRLFDVTHQARPALPVNCSQALRSEWKLCLSSFSPAVRAPTGAEGSGRTPASPLNAIDARGPRRWIVLVNFGRWAGDHGHRGARASSAVL